jgi:kelch-like protein 1/4/5
MPGATHVFAACAIGSDIYVFGGYDGVQSQATVFKYDTEADEWSTLAPMPHTAYAQSASVLGCLIYIVGSGDSGREVLRFDPVLESWSTLAPTSDNKKYGASFVLGDCLYAVGGLSQASSVEHYDVASSTWTSTAVANMIEGRKAFCAVTMETAGPAEERDLFDTLITKAARGGL